GGLLPEPCDPGAGPGRPHSDDRAGRARGGHGVLDSTLQGGECVAVEGGVDLVRCADVDGRLGGAGTDAQGEREDADGGDQTSPYAPCPHVTPRELVSIECRRWRGMPSSGTTGYG